MSSYIPYQSTQQDAARERRRALLMRAFGGLSAKGPRLGTDPFGSFQAGLRGALSMGQQQEKADQDQLELLMRQHAERAATDPMAGERAKIAYIEARLGRPLTEDELRQRFDINPTTPYERMTPAEKIQAAIDAGNQFGFKVGPEEMKRAGGFYVAQDESSIPALTGETKELASDAYGMGFPMANVNQPPPAALNIARHRRQYAHPGARLSWVPSPLPGQPPVATASFEGLDAGDVESIRGNSAYERVSNYLNHVSQLQRDSDRLLAAYHRGDWALIEALSKTGGDTKDPRIKDEAANYLYFRGR